MSDNAEWPILDPDALYGVAGEIVNAIRPHTESDPVAVLGQLLVGVGNEIGRTAFFVVEATKHHTNLFMVLVGATAKARKGTSEGWIRELFKRIDAAWVKDCIKSGLSSGEGLIWFVRDPIERLATAKEKAGGGGNEFVVADHGVVDKRLLIIESEFGGTLRVMKREGNILTVVIRDAWDSGTLNQMVKQNPARATGAHISIIGHITREELTALLGEVDAFNGFANRFIWMCVDRSQILPEGGASIDLEPFVERVGRAIEFAKTVAGMTRSEEAKALWRAFYTQQAEKRLPGRLGAVTDRAEPIVLRLSMVYALLDCSAEIRVEHLKAAIAMWKYAEDSARHVFGASTGNSLADKILSILRSEGSKTRKELHDRLSNHCKRIDLERALEQLKRLKLVQCEKDKSTGGRPAERWSAT